MKFGGEDTLMVFSNALFLGLHNVPETFFNVCAFYSVTCH